jgi:hypothetical protein
MCPWPESTYPSPEIDEETEDWWVQAYVCINEMVQHPPAIGDLPPERFRQAGS